jgi:hypothetical protein
MKSQSSKFFLYVSIAAFALLPMPAQAADSELTVSAIPAEFVVSGPEPETELVSVDVTLTSDTPKRIVVTFVDYFTGEDGQRVKLPGGSTPYSLQNVLEVEEFDNLHKGGGIKQEFTVVFKPKQKFERAVFSGGISIGVGPEGEVGEGVGSSGAITRSMTVTPFGIAADLAGGDLKAATITRHDLIRLERSSFFDSILPDLPGIVNYGPVESRIEYENDGQFPVFYTLRWNFVSGDESIASRSFPSTLFGPGQTKNRAVNTILDSETEALRLNVLPSFGFIENKIQLTSTLGGTDFPPEVYDGSFLVIQWKEPLVALVALYFVIRFAWRRNLSKRKKEESASLVWLGLVDLVKRFKKGLKTRPGSATPNQTSPDSPPLRPTPNRYLKDTKVTSYPLDSSKRAGADKPF